MLKTYDEWKAEGMQVMRGQRCVGKNKQGKALFSEDQVMDEYEGADYDELSDLYHDLIGGDY